MSLAILGFPSPVGRVLRTHGLLLSQLKFLRCVQSERLYVQCCIASLHILFVFIQSLDQVPYVLHVRIAKPCICSVANETVLLVKSDRAQNEQQGNRPSLF